MMTKMMLTAVGLQCKLSLHQNSLTRGKQKWLKGLAIWFRWHMLPKQECNAPTNGLGQANTKHLLWEQSQQDWKTQSAGLLRRTPPHMSSHIISVFPSSGMWGAPRLLVMERWCVWHVAVQKKYIIVLYTAAVELQDNKLRDKYRHKVFKKNWVYTSPALWAQNSSWDFGTG